VEKQSWLRTSIATQFSPDGYLLGPFWLLKIRVDKRMLPDNLLSSGIKTIFAAIGSGAQCIGIGSIAKCGMNTTINMDGV
jgi:hypothetical protein